MRDRTSSVARRLIPGAFLLLAACAREYPQTMVEPVTEFGRIQTALWATVTWWTVGIMVVVFGALTFILIRYRERPDSPEPKPIYGSAKLEIAWTVIPALIILAIAVPTIRAIFATQPEAPEDALVIEAIGHQWWWEFRYPEQDIITANEFYVPVGRPIALKLRSADVIHSFWIPNLGAKIDMIPGRTNAIEVRADSPGEYRGQCAEFCGMQHAQMAFIVVVEQPTAFSAWLESQRTPAAPPADPVAVRGLQTFIEVGCAACHTIRGTPADGTVGPDLTHLASRSTLAAGSLPNSPGHLGGWIVNPQRIKPGNNMPGASLEPIELRALLRYLDTLD